MLMQEISFSCILSRLRMRVESLRLLQSSSLYELGWQFQSSTQVSIEFLEEKDMRAEDVF